MARRFVDLAQTAAKGSAVTLHPSWGQGRSAFGGISSALVVARLHELANYKPLRSILVTFAGPLLTNESFSIEAETLWKGKAVSHIRADAIQNNKPQVCVAGCFGDRRPGKLNMQPERKIFTSQPHDVERLPVPPEYPQFFSQFDIRWTGPGRPGLGDPRGRELSLWARHMDSDVMAHPAARLVAMADIPPPVVMSHFRDLRPASSATWALNFFVDPAEVTSEWLFLEYHLAGGCDGYTQQIGMMYDSEGRAVCASHQTMVYFE